MRMLSLVQAYAQTNTGRGIDPSRSQLGPGIGPYQPASSFYRRYFNLQPRVSFNDTNPGGFVTNGWIGCSGLLTVATGRSIQLEWRLATQALEITSRFAGVAPCRAWPALI